MHKNYYNNKWLVQRDRLHDSISTVSVGSKRLALESLRHGAAFTAVGTGITVLLLIGLVWLDTGRAPLSGICLGLLILANALPMMRSTAAVRKARCAATTEAVQDLRAAVDNLPTFDARWDAPAVSGSTSDGYHTFDELYEHRYALFLLAVIDRHPHPVWYSDMQHDGPCYPGYILVGMDLPEGTITYHVPEKYADLLADAGVRYRGSIADYDGHTSQDVVDRLHARLSAVAKKDTDA